MTLISAIRLDERVPFPTKATKFSACYDLRFYATGDRLITRFDLSNNKYTTPVFGNHFTIYHGERIMVPTGLILQIPPAHHVKIYPRSSVALKSGMMLVNSVGIIDEDFKDELKLLMINMSERPFDLVEGDRLAQMEIVNTQPDAMWDEGTDEIRVGGFGSTGS